MRKPSALCVLFPMACLLIGISHSATATAAESPRISATREKLERGEPTKIVCLGDSVTGVYYHTGGLLAYPELLGIAVQKSYPKAKVTVINAGISGNSSANGLERLERDVISQKPDLVTVMFGLNDIVRGSPEAFQTNMTAIITRCRQAGAEVLLCTPNDVIDTGARPVKTLLVYCEQIHALGKKLSVPVADCQADLAKLRAADSDAFRLLLSDEIHPNLPGHKKMATTLAEAITGKPVALDELPVTPLILTRIADAVSKGRTVKVLAMPPLDAAIEPVLEKRFPGIKLEVTPWVVADKTLPQIEKEAQAMVRKLRPDLVLIGVPRSAKYASREQLIHSYTWIMNWSLSFGVKEWECLVVHPAVLDPAHPQPELDDMIRRLVPAQDLQLIDRKPGDQRSVEELLADLFKH